MYASCNKFASPKIFLLFYFRYEVFWYTDEKVLFLLCVFWVKPGQVFLKCHVGNKTDTLVKEAELILKLDITSSCLFGGDEKELDGPLKGRT